MKIFLIINLYLFLTLFPLKDEGSMQVIFMLPTFNLLSIDRPWRCSPKEGPKNTQREKKVYIPN